MSVADASRTTDEDPGQATAQDPGQATAQDPGQATAQATGQATGQATAQATAQNPESNPAVILARQYRGRGGSAVGVDPLWRHQDGCAAFLGHDPVIGRPVLVSAPSGGEHRP